MMLDHYANDRIREAAALIRHRVDRATPGPWRLSTSEYAALVADEPHPSRRDPTSGGWAWDEGYGGCLIGESMMTGDRFYFTTMQPEVGAFVADMLETIADHAPNDSPLLAAAVNVADRVIDVIPRGKSDQWWEATR